LKQVAAQTSFYKKIAVRENTKESEICEKALHNGNGFNKMILGISAI